MKISALILARNEEEMLEGCLRQLSFANEIIVLDQMSTDNTVKIAKKFTDKILKTTNKDFDFNRNLLLKEAKGDWLLYVDSDERIGTDLKQEIMKSCESTKYSAYYMPRKNIILGKWLSHGGWWPDYVPKLFRKKDMITWHGRVHESPSIDGQFGYLKNPLEHYTARSISMMLQKSIVWAKTEASLAYDANHPQVTIPKVIKAILFEFISRYILKAGFLDGTIGLIEGVYQSLHRAVVLTYLWELQNKTENEFTKYKNE